MDSRVAELLRAARTIAVVGLSPRPLRPSHEVAAYLQRAGYRIIPVNPKAAEILGERAFAHLNAVPVPVDIVDVFRRGEHVPAIAEAAIAIGARCLWLQEGVAHELAAARAAAAGLVVVEDRCLMLEHRAWRRAGRI